MHIGITNQISENQTVIYLIKKDTGLANIPLTDDQKSYIKTCIRNDQTQVFINEYNRWVCIQVQDPEKDGNAGLESLRIAGHKLHRHIVSQKIEAVQLVDKSSVPGGILALAEGLALSNYQFLKYINKADKRRHSLNRIDVYGSAFKEEVAYLKNVIEGVYFARNLINEPLSYLTAEKLSEEIAAKGEAAGFKVEVYHKQKIKSLKMGGLLAVNRGSVDPPTFSVLEWKPENAINKKPLVLVGKGIVFDTGGLSLKPTKDSMDYMKSDMSGAAAVAGVLYAISRSNIPVHTVGLIPATDNRPHGNAYTPGDIVHMGNGMTVEVLNTDAEGRMILAEALHYAKNYDPALVIDIATLTGAAASAIGKYGMVGMGNAGPEIFMCLKESADKVSERIVEFPFWDEYKDLLKSTIADIKNIGGKEAGAVTAGKFLEYFTDYPYIHLDIAGPAFVQKEYDYHGIGGTGYGIRSLFEFIRNCKL